MTTLDWHAERSDLGELVQLDRIAQNDGIDHRAVRRYRQARVRAQMARHGVDAVLLSDPVSIRYATGARNMQVFSMRNAPERYLLLTGDRAILYEFAGCEHLARELETIDEIRPALTASYVAAGPGIAERERRWASEMAQTVAEMTGGRDATLGLERFNAGAALALAEEGLQIADAQAPVEMARAIKSA